MKVFDENIYGESPQLQEVTNAARLVSATDVTVLIHGESGTGKELLARAIHENSLRAGKPFVSVNCASLSEELADSMLFGHRKGAFTGATADHSGYVKTAAGGTLFLDEVGELAPGVQARLLRFLESGECHTVGSAQPRAIDVRIITATNRDLARDAGEGAFRADLFYRLNVVPLTLPPLRERPGDVKLLLKRVTDELACRHQLTPPRYSRAARAVLERYRWPGNIRELRNFSERMLILCRGRSIEVENLPLEMRGGSRTDRVGEYHLPATGVRLDELEVSLIHQALDRTGGNRSRAARLLGLTRDTLLYRLKKYAIQA